MATPTQMQEVGIDRGIPWFGHFGFLDVAVVVHPALAYATARMWPLWQQHAGIMIGCIIIAGIIGAVLQTAWSDMADSSDAWSEDHRPTSVGIVHILHMSIEIGIMLMVLVSFTWHMDMPVTLFGGVALITLAHLVMGTHWPLKWWAPDWRPMGEGWSDPLPNGQGAAYLFGTLAAWCAALFLFHIS